MYFVQPATFLAILSVLAMPALSAPYVLFSPFSEGRIVEQDALGPLAISAVPADVRLLEILGSLYAVSLYRLSRRGQFFCIFFMCAVLAEMAYEEEIEGCEVETWWSLIR